MQTCVCNNNFIYSTACVQCSMQRVGYKYKLRVELLYCNHVHSTQDIIIIVLCISKLLIFLFMIIFNNTFCASNVVLQNWVTQISKLVYLYSTVN